MILQEEKYIEKYYGVYREVIFNSKNNSIIIYFNAFLNDDLNFKFEKIYKTKDEAFKDVEKFINHDKDVIIDIEYSKEAIEKINKSLQSFLQAIIDNKVPLPSKDYIYQGDMNNIKIAIDKKYEFVYWEDA